MHLAQIQPPQLPALPEGPLLERTRGPVELPAYETWQIALAVLFILLVVGSILWALLRSRRKTPERIEPYAAAVAELENAAQLTAGDDERFVMLASTALRRYLEDDLGLRFRSRTSEEFLRSLKGNTRLDTAFQSKLRDLLAAFDQLKFAKSSLSPADRIQISDTVRELIDEAHASQSKEGREA